MGTGKILEEIKANIDGGQTDAVQILKPFFNEYYKGIQLKTERMFYNLGLDILEELKNHPKIDKTQLYLAMSLLSTYSNDEMNATVFWELAQKGNINGLDNVIANLGSTYSSVMNAVTSIYDNNLLIKQLMQKFTFINDYQTILQTLTDVNKAHFLSCGIMQVRIINLLRENNGIEIIKIYAQELLNSLCTLNESLLKIKFNCKDIGNALKTIHSQNQNIAQHLGLSSNKSGLFQQSQSDFYNSYNNFISNIENNITNEDELKANILYALNRLRNEALHTFDIQQKQYFNNNELFEKTIGLLFISISVINAL